MQSNRHIKILTKFLIMKKNIIVLTMILFISFFIFSCKQNSTEIQTVNLNVNKEIKLDSSFVYKEICSVDSKNIVLKERGSYFFILIDKKNTSLFKEVLKKGKGPGEFVFLEWINNPYNKFLFYDLITKKVFELTNNKNVKELAVLKCNANFPSFINMITDSIYIASGMFHKARFGIFDGKGNLINETGYYPITDSLKIDNYFFNNVYQSKLVSKPNNPKILACISSFSKVLEIFKYNTENKTLNRINRIDLNTVIYDKVSQNGMKYIVTSDNVIGSVFITVTKKNIYTLYNKNTLSVAKKNNTKLYCNEVRVYDWKGNLVKKYHLEKPTKSIYVYDNELYALGMNDKYNTEIDVYKLDK